MDETRFRVEYERVCDQLFTFLVRMAGSHDRAADVLQEAAYRAYRSRKKFRGDSSFKTWIYRIAINIYKNQQVRAARERSWSEAEGSLERGNSPTPEKILAGRQEAAGLARALEMLEEGYRVPFLLKHVDGLSYREICQVLDLTESAARVRVHRAREALMALLREDGR